MKSPFKFLDAYTKEDRDIFFGREKEIEELYHRVFDSRILLVYGESGTGKSSLIQCGLANKFRDSDWLPVMIRRGDNLPDSIARAVKASATTPIDYELLTTGIFKKAIRSLYIDYYKPIFFIFDQFEELFIFGSKEEKQSLVHLVHALVDSDIECRFIFVMREEYLASVGEFEKSFPGFNSNRMRIERMALANAVRAISGPCEVYDIEVEEGFPEKLLKKLNPDTPGVELTWLQVYLDKIFNLATSEAEKTKTAVSFTLDMLEKTGDVSDILGTFLEEQIAFTSDKEAALVVLKSFVSVKGTKRQLTIDEARENVYTLGKQMNDPELMELIQRFVHLRILRDKDQYGKYELRHDALAKKVFEKFTSVEKELIEIRQFIDNSWDNWQKRKVLISAEDLDYISPYESKLHLPVEMSELIEKSKKELVRKRQLRRNLIGISGIALIVVLSGFTIWALLERKKSDINYIKAKANNFGMMAREVAIADPTKALRLAEYAMTLDSSEDVRKIMYQIYRENSFYEIIAKLPGSVNAICLSPDGKHLLTGCDDGIARLMDLQGNLVQEFKAHTNAIRALAFSPSGDSVLTGSSDNNAILWSINGEILHIYKGHKSWVLSVAFSPNGKMILTGSQDNTTRLWDIKGNVLNEVSKNFYCRSVAFSPDGKTFLSIVDTMGPSLFNLQGKLIRSFNIHRGVQKTAFSPDGGKIISSSTQNDAVMYNLEGKILARFEGHENRVLGVAFSPDGKHILTTSEDNTVRVWNSEGELTQVLKGHGADVYSAIFSSDGKTIYTASQDNTVRSWEFQNNFDFLFAIQTQGFLRDARFSNESNTILLFLNNFKICLYDLTGKLIKDFRLPLNNTNSGIRFSPDGQKVFAAVYNIGGFLWSNQGKILAEFERLTYCGFVSDSIVFTYYNNNKTINLYNLNGKLINQFKTPYPVICSSPDGKALLYAYSGNTLRLTDTRNNLQRIFRGHEGVINAIAFSPDGKRILSGSNDNTAILWDIDGSVLIVFQEHTGAVIDVSFSPDGRRILTLDADATVRLWDLDGNLLQVLRGKKFPLKAAFFTKESNKILTVGRSGEIHLHVIKSSLANFQKRDSYEELSISQKIEMGIISIKEVMKFNDADQLSEAAEWYYSNSSISKTYKKEEYLNNTFELFDMISEKSPERVDFLIQMLRIYIDSYVLDPKVKTSDEVAGINKKVLNLKAPDDLFSAANYYRSLLSSTDSTIYKLNLLNCLSGLAEKINTLTETNDSLAKLEMINLRNISYTLVQNRQFKTGLKGLQICYNTDSSNIVNVVMVTLAYILNNQTENAERIINKWKETPVQGYENINVYSFRDAFLYAINDLETRGITNPDYERARELLKK